MRDSRPILDGIIRMITPPVNGSFELSTYLKTLRIMLAGMLAAV
jgi:hypothetical protein